MMYYKYINDRQVFSQCKVIETSDGIWISNPSEEQILEAGWQIYIPPEVTPTPETTPDYELVISAVKKMLESSTEALSDESALEVAALFPTWIDALNENKELEVGKRLWYDGKLYKVIQRHTPQSDWTPDVTQALYAEISVSEMPDWIQPISAETAYNLGDKVKHNNKTWESDYNANVWEPGVYGWHEI